MAAREIMDSVGLGQKYSNEIIGKVHRIGNNLGLPGPALADTLEGLEEDVKEREREVEEGRAIAESSSRARGSKAPGSR